MADPWQTYQEDSRRYGEGDRNIFHGFEKDKNRRENAKWAAVYLAFGILTLTACAAMYHAYIFHP